MECISDVMVSMLTTSTLDCGSSSIRLKEKTTNIYKIRSCCLSVVALRIKSKDWLARDQNMLSNGATCLPVDCCFLF